MIHAMNAAVELPKSVPELQDIVVSQQEEIAHLKQQYVNPLEQIKLAKLRQYDPKSESNLAQWNLFDEAESLIEEETSEAGSEDDSETITYLRKKPSRKPLPKNLPREEIIHDVETEEKQCECGC